MCRWRSLRRLIGSTYEFGEKVLKFRILQALESISLDFLTRYQIRNTLVAWYGAEGGI